LRGLAAGSLGGLAALLVHSAFDFDLRIPSNAVMAALLVSMALAGVAVRTTSAWTARALAALFGLAVLASVPRAAFPVDPDAGWGAAREEARLAAASAAPEARRLRLDLTERALRATLRRRPAQAEAWLLLAGVRADRGDPEAAELARWA